MDQCSKFVRAALLTYRAASWTPYRLSAALVPAGAAPGIAIAGISREMNSFNRTKATLADFEGEDALSSNRR